MILKGLKTDFDFGDPTAFATFLGARLVASQLGEMHGLEIMTIYQEQRWVHYSIQLNPLHLRKH